MNRFVVAALALSTPLLVSCASGGTPTPTPTGPCVGFGPQTPRDIANTEGSNTVVFPTAPPSTEMNLCNIHFHNGAEHRAPDFAIPVVAGGHAKGGFQCAMSTSLTEAERAPFADNACDGVKSGDTIEVHWVHSTCDVAPGPTLNACLSAACSNPSLRVETQVFTVVNDRDALDFQDLAKLVERDGRHQTNKIPSDTGDPIEFLGSTTGPSFTESVCSPFQVSWSVRPACAKVDIASLSAWCADNAFDEDHAHGVRKLVTNKDLLAPIQ